MFGVPRATAAYLGAVLLLGIGLTVYCFARFPPLGDLTTWLLFAAFALLAFLTERYGLHFARGTQVHVDTIPLFAGVLVFNSSHILLITALARLTGRIGLGRQMRERIFNFGQTLTYVALSSLVLQAFVKIPWQPKGVLSWIGLLMTASAMYLLNTGLVAGIISISSQIPFTRIWLESLAPALLEHLVMFSFGTLTALVVVLYPWGLVLMALPSAAVFIMLDRTLRMEAQHKQLAEQNAGLATYLSQQAEQLREAYRALEETLEAKNKVLQSIFLKLRTPLETVASRSRLVRQKLEAGQVTAAAADLDLVLHNSQMTWHFVNDFVSLQVLERRQLLLEDVTVEQLFRDALEAVEEHVLSTGLDVYADYAEDLPVLRADRVRLKLMLIHLLDNAIRFSPAGGKVLLNARSAADGMVQITVTDYGQGIPKAQLPHVFDWFARVDVVVTSEAESYGLGLAIAQRVAELHGGAVQIESQPEQMTTVTVTLPSQLPGVAAGSYSA